MHDIKFIRDNPAAFDAALAKRGLQPMSPMILRLDENKRSRQTELQELQNQRNQLAKSIGMAKSKGENIEPIMAQSKEVNDKIAKLEAALS